MDLAVEVYKIIPFLPSNERYGLIDQIRRSAVSVPSNIAEGAGRNSNKEFSHFIGISNGSANELFSQLLLTHRLGMIEEDKIIPNLELIKEIKKMNYSLKNKLIINKV